MEFFRLNKKMKRLMVKNPKKFSVYMGKMERRGKIETITKEQAEKEGLIQYIYDENGKMNEGK